MDRNVLQTDRQKVTHMSPPCKVHRWAQHAKCTGGLKNYCIDQVTGFQNVLIDLLYVKMITRLQTYLT